MNNLKFENVSQNGLCNVFASQVAKKENLDIYMVVHNNPDWDECDQTPDEFTEIIKSKQVMIIHCIVSDKNGDCFDSSGYIYRENYEILNSCDSDFYEEVIKIIANQCSHGNLYEEDPFDVLEFTSEKLAYEIQHNYEQYDMNPLSNVLEKKDHIEYLKWVDNFTPN